MAESLPAIRVTDPNSRDRAPTLPQSPNNNRNNHAADGKWDGEFRRPTSPASRNSSSREGRATPSSPTYPSPGKLLRNLSNTVANQVNGGMTSNGDTAPRQELPPMDPLSQQIHQRTTTIQSLAPSPGRIASTDASSDDKSVTERPSSRLSMGSARPDSAPKHLGSKIKAVSFLSRIIGSKKEKGTDTISDDASVYSDLRPEGAEAQVFSQSVDNIEFSPRHPQPPEYIKVRAKNMKDKDFDHLFLAQELQGASKPNGGSASGSPKVLRKASLSVEHNTVWSTEWSKDGRYLATAGFDKKVRIWAVLTNPDERRAEERGGSVSTTDSEVNHARLSAPVFQRKPIREYEGHTSAILDLSWSKNNFLLSSSMDKTVRLWHVSRAECLCTFKHNDFVPSISFHPRDDRFFLAGSLDAKLRLWSIPDKTVAFWSQLPDMITAVSFTPDGKYAIAGCLNGLCMFYETEGLKYQTQIQVRSAHGKNAKGNKITGIQTMQVPPNSANGDIKLLISSNDSRIRLYNFRDKSMEIKFKGSQNSCSQIRASMSDNFKYVACGSEDHRAYVWPIGNFQGEGRDKQPVEMFEAHKTITTCVTFAPTKTRQLLGRSEDPIYDLCNPPPVTLVGKTEREGSQASSKPMTETADSVQSTPAEPDAKFDKKPRPTESAAQIARSTHNCGNIIVTADYSGRIKVFRQDCSWTKRKAEHWESSSSFLRRVGSAKLGRTPSMKTKDSNRSLRSARGSVASSHAPSERILSWRQGIASTSNVTIDSNRSTKGERSPSPRKSVGQLSFRSKHESSNLRSSAAATPTTLPSGVTANAPTSRDAKPATEGAATISRSKGGPQMTERQKNDAESEDLLDLGQTETNPLMLQGEQSNLFWNVAYRKQEMKRTREVAAQREKEERERQERERGERPALAIPGGGVASRSSSVVSTLSVERDTSGEEDQRSVSSGRGRRKR